MRFRSTKITNRMSYSLAHRSRRSKRQIRKMKTFDIMSPKRKLLFDFVVGFCVNAMLSENEEMSIRIDEREKNVQVDVC